jgi:alkyl hydroperoxide reductase subunit D
MTGGVVETILENQTSTIAKDLRLNLTRLLDGGALGPIEAHLALMAAAASAQQPELMAMAAAQLQALGLTEEHIQEAKESAAIMGMLNTYYRFRHFLGNPDDYRVAGLRMTALARPALGKERFEMLAFAVSVLNGCETCTRSHEKALRDAGVAVEKIHDLAKIAAVVKGLTALMAAARRV